MIDWIKTAQGAPPSSPPSSEPLADPAALETELIEDESDQQSARISSSRVLQKLPELLRLGSPSFLLLHGGGTHGAPAAL
jgi:hypothetical protein